MSALLLACLVPAAVAANYSYPATYKGTTASGGTVEFDVSADGASVTRFKATQVPMTCGMFFDATANGAFPIVAGSFSNGSPTTGLVFSGTFPAAGRAEGTVSYRIVNVRYDGCSSEAVSWTATAPRIVVAYRQEGGIGGPRPSLIVSGDRKARVTLGRCAAKFPLRRRAWNRLRAALRGADLPAIAGDYPPPKNSADVITYVIKAGRNTVRIAPAAEPGYDEVMRDLEPLLKVLNKVISAGERRMAKSCKSNRGRAAAWRARPPSETRRHGQASSRVSPMR